MKTYTFTADDSLRTVIDFLARSTGASRSDVLRVLISLAIPGVSPGPKDEKILEKLAQLRGKL